MIKQDRGAFFSVTASGTATAIATQAGTTSAIYYVTDISGSTNSSGTITVFGGATGTTALWTDFIGTNNAYQFSFSTPLVGNVGQSVKVQTYGSLISYANISGFQINAS